MGFTPRQITLKDSRVVTLRAATPDDAEAMDAFMMRLRATTPYVVTAPDEAQPVEQLREKLADDYNRPGALVLLAIPESDPSRVVADCWLMPFTERKMNHVASLGMGCDEHWQGVGLGTAMLNTAVKHAIEHPALRRIELGVMPENTHALRLYRNQGFFEEGRRPDRFKKSDTEYYDEVIMGRRVDDEHTTP